MKLSVKLRTTTSVATAFVCAIVVLWTANCLGQTTDSETDVAESMGVGLKSRFASGATPIELSRTQIVPGTPMNVSSTMSGVMASSSSGSFGGILSRYDTSNFGKFFGTGTLNSQRTSASRIDALDNLDQGDNEVENVETERMYPARLVWDFDKHPVRKLDSPESKATMASQVDNVLSRFEFDRTREEVRVDTDGATVFIRGKVRSGRMARLIECVISMQAGVDRVVNELAVMEPETNDVDVFGKPLKNARTQPAGR